MSESGNSTPAGWTASVQHLMRGDFSALEPLFEERSPVGDCSSDIADWYRQGNFVREPAALAEALTCACFLGRTKTAEFLLAQGVDAHGGFGTGMSAFHWAANRGQRETVKLLIDHKAPLEIKNMYGGTVLGTAVWSAVHEPKPDHPAIVEMLLMAGA